MDFVSSVNYFQSRKRRVVGCVEVCTNVGVHSLVDEVLDESQKT